MVTVIFTGQSHIHKVDFLVFGTLFAILKPDSSDAYMSDDKRTSSFEGFLITSTLFFLFCNKLLKLLKGLYIFRG